MQLPNLKSLYSTLSWYYNERAAERPAGSGVGIFIALPPDVAKQFPSDGRTGEDSSPAHITVCYLGDIPIEMEDKIEETVRSVCKMFRPFKVRLASPSSFVNKHGQTIIHSPIRSVRLHRFHEGLKNALMERQIPYDDKFPTYKPHCTIEYVDAGELPRYNKVRPVGEWIVDSVWVWGLQNPCLIPIGK